MEQEIRSLFHELGTTVFLNEVRDSPSYITYHYNVDSIKSLNQIEQKVKLISTYLNKNIIYKDSEIAHFAISIMKDKSNYVRLQDKKYRDIFDGSYKIFAGVDDYNNPYIINLKDTPHILVAGTTGSGKSVTVNSIICSLLKQFNYRMNFTMIDTKKVELSPYKNLGEDWCIVVTEPSSAIDKLKNLCNELDVRYTLMERNGWREIPDNYYREIVIIEELGDLMITSKGLVEKYIVRIAQLGRACGVHLIIATQRPTVDVITGAIKANIGCRFALQTTSSIDSRNILGHNGSEKLRGCGDCLLKLPDKAEEIHIQCPFISNEEILDVIRDF